MLERWLLGGDCQFLRCENGQIKRTFFGLGVGKNLTCELIGRHSWRLSFKR